MRTLSQSQMDKKFESDDPVLLINVLPSSAFAQGHIPGSINIPMDAVDFVARVQSEMDKDNQEIIVYCAGNECPAAANAAKKLEQAGLSQVLTFTGGLAEWTAAGHDIDTSAMEESEPDQLRAQAREDLGAATPVTATPVKDLLRQSPQKLKSGSSANQEAADPRDLDSKIRPH